MRSDVTPLAELTNLQNLNLDRNQITDISSLSGLILLEELFLEDNSIVDISPLVQNAGIGKGDRVDLSNNSLDCKDLEVLEDIQTIIDRSVSLQHDCD